MATRGLLHEVEDLAWNQLGGPSHFLSMMGGEFSALKKDSSCASSQGHRPRGLASLCPTIASGAWL